MKNFVYFLFKLPISNLIPGYFRKKYLKEKNIIFIPTNLKKLPKNNHPIIVSYEMQENLINEYINNNHTSLKTYEKLVEKLTNLFDKNFDLNFLDFGGDKIDLYLDLNKNFKNLKYFIINQPEINNIFHNLKSKYKFDNLFILNDENEIKKYRYDFAFFGSVIQYLKNYNSLLKLIKNQSKKYILISATHFFDNNNNKNYIIVKQLNFLPKVFYLHFFNFKILNDILSQNDFDLIEKNKNLSTNINYSLFDQNNFKNLDYYDLLFKRRL